MNNWVGRRLQVLQRECRDTFKAYEWIRDNSTSSLMFNLLEEHRFKREVFGPICLVINPKDPRMADVIETHINQAILEVSLGFLLLILDICHID